MSLASPVDIWRAAKEGRHLCADADAGGVAAAGAFGAGHLPWAAGVTKAVVESRKRATSGTMLVVIGVMTAVVWLSTQRTRRTQDLLLSASQELVTQDFMPNGNLRAENPQTVLCAHLVPVSSGSGFGSDQRSTDTLDDVIGGCMHVNRSAMSNAEYFVGARAQGLAPCCWTAAVNPFIILQYSRSFPKLQNEFGVHRSR